jgi:hypothetical protein
VRTPALRQLPLGEGPLQTLNGLVETICAMQPMPLPGAGLYWIEVAIDGVKIGSTPLWFEKSSAVLGQDAQEPALSAGGNGASRIVKPGDPGVH